MAIQQVEGEGQRVLAAEDEWIAAEINRGEGHLCFAQLITTI
jgi:hypothetical protein